MRLDFRLKTLLMHLVLTIGIFIIPIAYAPAPIIVFFLAYYYTKHKYVGVLITGCYSLICKSEGVFFMYILVLFALMLLDNKKIIKEGLIRPFYKKMRQILIYLLVLYTAQLIVDPSPLSLPFFFLTFLSYTLITIFIWKVNLSKEDVASLLTNILYIGLAQVLVALLFQAIPIGIGKILARPSYGDFVVGTTGNATTFSSVILFSILPFVLYQVSVKFRLTNRSLSVIIIALLSAFMLIISDSKTILYAMLLAIAAVVVLKILFKTRNITRNILIVLTSLLVLVFMFGKIADRLANVENDYSDYITGNYNVKYQYYQKIFDPSTRPLVQYVIGTGGGTNGSRAANALAYDALAKPEQTSIKMPSFIPPKTNSFTKRYVAHLYDADYREGIPNVSAILGSPFNSVCSIFIEFGIIGAILCLGFYYSIFKLFLRRMDDVLVTSLIVIVFTTWVIAFVFPSLEYPAMMYFVFLYLGLVTRQNREIISEKEQV